MTNLQGFFIGILSLFITLTQTVAGNKNLISFSQKFENVNVAHVIDGDTIITDRGQKVRYIGLDSAELSSSDCYAQEAYLKNKDLVEGKTIRLEKDLSDKDKYGRLLRYVYVTESTSSAQTIFVNDFLLRNGFAKVMAIAPNLRYYQQLKSAEKEAQKKDIGLWKKCLPGKKKGLIN